MRSKKSAGILFALASGVVASAASPPGEVLRSCAYTATLPPSARSVAVFSILGHSTDQLLTPDHGFSRGESFRVKIAAEIDGYFYLLQDPPDSGVPALVYPAGGKSDNGKLAKGSTRVLPATFAPPSFVLLLAFSANPVVGIERMSLAEVREYFRLRRYCGNFALEERSFQFDGKQGK